MKIIAGGNDRLALDTVKFLIKNNENLVAIFSENRGNPWEINFDKEAQILSKKFRIPLIKGNINYYEREIKNLNPDLIIPLRCKNIIRQKILDIPRKGCIHVHYGKLPKYAGGAPISWAILNGETKIAPTLQYMAARVDSGDIIDQKDIDITPGLRTIELPDKRKIEIRGMTAFEIYNKCNEDAFEMIRENFPLIKSGKNKKSKQDIKQIEYRFIDSLNYGKDKYIDLNGKSNEEISKHIRAFTFPPMQYPMTKVDGKYIALKIYPSLFNMAIEIAEYLNIDHSQIMDKYEYSKKKFPGFISWVHVTEQEWNSKNIDQYNKEETANFYKETPNYIFELMESWSTIHKNLMAEKVCIIMRNHGVERVLSYGTGIGQDVIYYCYNNFDVDTADLPGKTFDFAKWRFKKVNIKVNTIDIVDDYHLKDKYDAITCFEVLQHVVQPEETIKYFRKHLNENGLLIITTRFKNNYNLALINNVKYHDNFSDMVIEKGFMLVEKKHLWGSKEDGKYLFVFIKR